jgi:hypothetical protein
MTTRLLARARAAGLMLRIESGRLAVSGPKPPDNLLAALRAGRDDLIQELSMEACEISPARSPAVPAPSPAAPTEALDGLRRAALQRPPSWWNREPHTPPKGAWCSCCRLRQWWTRDRLGWCCHTCHPPDGLAPGEFEEVRT